MEEQQNLSGGVDLALRNGPESKMLGVDSSKFMSFSFCIPRPPHFLTSHSHLSNYLLAWRRKRGWRGGRGGRGGTESFWGS